MGFLITVFCAIPAAIKSITGGFGYISVSACCLGGLSILYSEELDFLQNCNSWRKKNSSINTDDIEERPGFAYLSDGEGLISERLTN